MKTDNKTIETKNNNAKAVPANKVQAKSTKMEKQSDAAKEAPLSEVKPKIADLETTLKVLENLQTRMRQRNKLINTIEKLESFELDVSKDLDELATNRFNACALTITDDNHHNFETRNPTIISAIVDLVKIKANEKLTEIEAEIVLP